MSYDGESGVSAAEVPRGGPDRFEIILWVLGLVLIAAALIAYSYAAAPSPSGTSFSCDDSGCATPPDYAIKQYTYAFAPGVLTGGIICVALALALRALSRILRQRELRPVVANSRDRAPSLPSTEPVWNGDPRDERMFMRPSD
jgi:hypothetical protein